VRALLDTNILIRHLTLPLQVGEFGEVNVLFLAFAGSASLQS
jgi:hypothetical protein